MFYVTLWLVMFIGWILFLVWGMTTETRDRKRARAAVTPAPARAPEPRPALTLAKA